MDQNPEDPWTDAYGTSTLLDMENAAGQGHEQPDVAGTALWQGWDLLRSLPTSVL